MTRESHLKKVLTHLLDGHRITELGSYILWKKWRVGARVCNLRRDYGLPVRSRIKPGYSHSEYWIERADLSPEHWETVSKILGKEVIQIA